MNITDCPEIRTPIISSRHATLLSLPLPLSSCSFMPLSLSLFITFSSSLSPCTTKKMITSTKALGIKAARDGAQKAKKKEAEAREQPVYFQPKQQNSISSPARHLAPWLGGKGAGQWSQVQICANVGRCERRMDECRSAEE